MYSKFFSIPKAVYYYCFLPIIIMIILCLIFYIAYRKKRGTYYYTFTVNYFFIVVGIVISAILISLLLGYSTATIYTIYVNGFLKNYNLFLLLLIIIPLIPISLFGWLIIKFKNNLLYKKELDKNY